MRCPYCSFLDTRVVDKRHSEDATVARRRRECGQCGKRFTTYERVEEITFSVLKKEGRPERFDKEKLRRGLVISAEKRPISEEQLEAVLDDIVDTLTKRSSNEVSSSDIGRMVLSHLKKLDTIAYLRFASVFLEFENVEAFRAEIETLKTTEA